MQISPRMASLSGRACVNFFLPVAICRWTGYWTKALRLMFKQRSWVPQGRPVCINSIYLVNKSNRKPKGPWSQNWLFPEKTIPILQMPLDQAGWPWCLRSSPLHFSPLGEGLLVGKSQQLSELGLGPDSWKWLEHYPRALGLLQRLNNAHYFEIKLMKMKIPTLFNRLKHCFWEKKTKLLYSSSSPPLLGPRLQSVA